MARLRSTSLSPDAKRKRGGGRRPVLPEIFVGYSHDTDERWLKEVLLPFKPAKEHGWIEIFSDQSLKAGDRWHPRIQTHLQRADVALLLIDSHFLASSYCLDKELSPLLERQEKGELEIIPLLVERSLWMLFPSLRSLHIHTFDRMALAEVPSNRIQTYLSPFAWEILKTLGVTPPEDPDPDQPSPGAPHAKAGGQRGSATRLRDGKRRGWPRGPKGYDIVYYDIAWPDLVAERPFDAFLGGHSASDLHLRPADVDRKADAFASFEDELRKLKAQFGSGISDKPGHVLVLGGGTGKSTLLHALVSLEQEPVFVDGSPRLLDGNLDRVFKANAVANFIDSGPAALRDLARLAAGDLHLWLDGLGNTAETCAFDGQQPIKLAPIKPYTPFAEPRMETANYDGLIDLTWDREEERWVHPGTLKAWQAWVDRAIEIQRIELTLIELYTPLAEPRTEIANCDGLITRDPEDDLRVHLATLASLQDCVFPIRVNNIGDPVEIPLNFGRVLRDLIADGRSIFVDPRIDHDFKCTFLEIFSIDKTRNLAEDFRGDGGWPPSYVPVDLTNTSASTGELLPF